MSEENSEFSPAISRLLDDIRKDEEALGKKKEMVNQLCEYAGAPPMFQNVKGGSADHVHALRSDQFYGKPLATAVREFLEMRKASGLGASSIPDIFNALQKGGYKFGTKDDTNAKTVLRTALRKNTTTFHKLPNGDYGLLSWYPKAKEQPSETNNDSAEEVVSSKNNSDQNEGGSEQTDSTLQ